MPLGSAIATPRFCTTGVAIVKVTSTVLDLTTLTVLITVFRFLKLVTVRGSVLPGAQQQSEA